MSKYFDSKSLQFMEPQVIEHGRHVVMTNVNPEMKTKFINIDTRFQQEFNINNYADFSIVLPQSIRDVHSMKMTHIEIPASFYPFSAQFKNTFFHIQFDTTSTVVKINDGVYTVEEIIAAINFMLGTSINIEFSYDAVTRTCSIENTTSHELKIKFAVDENGNDDRFGFKTKLGWCLGFRETEYIITNGETITSEGIITVDPCRYLFVSIDDFHSHNPNSFIVPSFDSYFDSNVLSRISLDPESITFGKLIVANESGGKLLSDIRTYKGKSDLQKLRIKLYNEFGELVDLNQMDMSFALEIKYT